MQTNRIARRLTSAVLALGLVFVAASAFCASITIDDFSTNQSALTLTYPPAGTSASSSVSGSGILGGERDLQVNLTGGVIAGNTLSATVSSGFLSYSQDATIAGNTTLQWDGTDGSPTLNPTGLGGVDLTSGHTQDAMLLSVFFDDLPVNTNITLYTDAGNASAYTISLPGLLFSSTNFVIPFSSFTTTLGTGADPTNIGAITLSMGSTTTAPDVVIDFIQTTATVTASQTVALLTDVNGNAVANNGDTLRYTLVINNPTDATGAASDALTASAGLDPNTTLIVGSVTTTQGSVTTGNTSGDTAAVVNVGSLADGATATITFDVTVNTLPSGTTQISSQASITSTALSGGVLSDDPTVGGTADPTVITAAAAPVVTSVSPARGPLAGGTSVTITGTGFTGATAVDFGATAAGSFTIVSDTSITTSAPVGSGIVDVSVTTPNGGTSATSAADQFTYFDPTASVALSSSSNPSVFGESVTFSVSVSGSSGIPTGSVTFMDGASALATPTLDGSGDATFTTASLAASTHSITAVYSGDSTYNTGTSNTVSQIVNTGNTTTTLTSNINPSSAGQSVMFTATVSASAPSAGAPTGSVQFFNGATSLGTIPLSGDVATLSLATLGAGADSISAVYSGDDDFNASTSNLLSQSVRGVGAPLQIPALNSASLLLLALLITLAGFAIRRRLQE